MKAIVMLHIPRPGRFADEVNLSQIEEIAQDFMDLRLIIAHPDGHTLSSRREMPLRGFLNTKT